MIALAGLRSQSSHCVYSQEESVINLCPPTRMLCCPLCLWRGDPSNLMLSLILSSVLQMTNLGTESPSVRDATRVPGVGSGFYPFYLALLPIPPLTKAQKAKTALLFLGMLVETQWSCVKSGPGHKNRHWMGNKRTLLFSTDAFPRFYSPQQASRPLCYSV